VLGNWDVLKGTFDVPEKQVKKNVVTPDISPTGSALAQGISV